MQRLFSNRRDTVASEGGCNIAQFVGKRGECDVNFLEGDRDLLIFVSFMSSI